MEKITIAMCVYNAEEYLKETLLSLEKQTYKDIEYLFINDGSTDDSEKILLDFKNNNNNSTIINLNENKGTAFARNKALTEAKTRLMMFFDSDDVAKPELVEKLHDKIQETKNCIAVSCYAQYISDNGKKLNGGMFMGDSDPQKFLEKAKAGKLTFMAPATLFVRKMAIDAGGYHMEGFPNADIRYEDLSEDLDLWSRMSDFAFEDKVMIVVDKVLYYYRKRSNSLSAPKDKQFAMSLKIKYIKHNLKRRRIGEKEVTFVQYMEDMSEKEKQLKRGFYAEYYYRKAAFGFVDRKLLMIVPWLCTSFVCKPSYLFQKFLANYKK